MTRRRPARAVAVLAAAGLAALLVSPAAHAADEIGIDHIESAERRVSLVLSVDGLPTGAIADPSSVAVEVDGRAVDATAKIVSAGDIDRSTVLVLDASNSMRGAKFAAATAAVNAFLDQAPADVAIGLVTFAGDIQQTIEPTTDHDAIRTALLGIELSKGTSVYDALLEGVDIVGAEGSRAVLLLSDGADTGSATTLEVASSEAEDREVVVDVVSLGRSAKASEIAGLAEDTGGKVIPADPAALSTVFAAQADALAQQILVTFDAPDDSKEEASITVTLRADETSYTDSAFVTLAAATSIPDVVENGKALVSTPLMLLGALVLFLGLVGLMSIVISGPRIGRSNAERRLDSYFGSTGGTPGSRKKATADSGALDSAVAMTNKVVSADMETRIAQRLAGAGSALTAAEWLLMHVGIAVGSALVCFILGGPGLAVLGLIGGAVLPWIYLRFRHRRRLNAFNAQLAESLGLMAGGLQAGLSLPQAVDTVVREGHEPIAGELRRALIEQRLGVDITDAMDGVALRMESENFAWVVMAIRIQREVGGNLAEILNTVADTLREREYLKRQVRSLSAEGRLSGYILGFLPPAIFVYLYFVNNEYVRPLYTTFPGYIMLLAAFVLLALGSFSMSKLAKVEV
ncbi:MULTISPECIES: type II secretion system F family protein [Nocardioides]|uniref:type II secretion system F family protein n=1 Tax=Nocardioides TaxID=1839 RepID=UPI00032F4E7D|nr:MULTISPECIES: type II secretion system F family protein [Nocardioides]EON23343.1 type II secretion system protein [Nocardioides sp. CF8]